MKRENIGFEGEIFLRCVTMVPARCRSVGTLGGGIIHTDASLVDFDAVHCLLCGLRIAGAHKSDKAKATRVASLHYNRYINFNTREKKSSTKERQIHSPGDHR